MPILCFTTTLNFQPNYSTMLTTESVFIIYTVMGYNETLAVFALVFVTYFKYWYSVVANLNEVIKYHKMSILCSYTHASLLH